MRTRLSFLLTFALVLLRKDGVAKPLRAICGSGACDLEGRYVAGVFAEFYGDQMDWLVKAAIFVCVSLLLQLRNCAFRHHLDHFEFVQYLWLTKVTAEADAMNHLCSTISLRCKRQCPMPTL